METTSDYCNRFKREYDQLLLEGFTMEKHLDLLKRFYSGIWDLKSIQELIKN